MKMQFNIELISIRLREHLLVITMTGICTTRDHDDVMSLFVPPLLSSYSVPWYQYLCTLLYLYHTTHQMVVPYRYQ